VTSTRPINVLMEAAGFEAIEVHDVTRNFIDTAEAWFKAFATRAWSSDLYSEMNSTIGRGPGGR
jgi:hypothetical protein